MFPFTLSEILTELKTRFSSYLLLLLSNSEERLGAETARACHFAALRPTFPLGSHQMPGRFVKNQPVMLNMTIQREQQWKSHKVGPFPEFFFHFFFFFLGGSPKNTYKPQGICLPGAGTILSFKISRSIHLCKSPRVS